MNRTELINQIRTKESFLCVGLDSDYDRLPKHLLNTEDPIFEFNKAIIDATAEHCVAYKPNIAFYESQGVKGWEALEKTIAYIPDSHFIIADAKRGDIGNTSKMYAKAFFENMNCNSITVAPYMGVDSVSPFLDYPDKWVIILGFLEKSSKWGNTSNTMFVVGATHPEAFKNIRSIVPDHFLLVPGVGAQGGSLKGVCDFGLNEDIGLLINSSRSIIFASDQDDFAEAAKQKAKEYHLEMKEILNQKFS